MAKGPRKRGNLENYPFLIQVCLRYDYMKLNYAKFPRELTLKLINIYVELTCQKDRTLFVFQIKDIFDQNNKY